MLSQSLLARIGTEVPLRAGVRENDTGDGFHWQMTIAPHDSDVPEGVKAQPLVSAWDVAVNVSWGDSKPHSLTLNTVLLGTIDE